MEFNYSFVRLGAVLVKEFNQLRRDLTTFIIIISIPLIQIIMFGYAINTDPKYLPTAVLNSDPGPFSRSVLQSLKNTHYFEFTHYPETEKAAEELIKTGRVQFVVNIPSDFSRQLVRGESPAVLIEADGTDPVSVGNAISAASELLPYAFKYDFNGILNYLKDTATPAAAFLVHSRYNPDRITQYNIVPGLMGVILTLTFVMVTGMALAKEREQGTLENLLATPAKPLEIIVGKSLPYVIVGYLQVILIMIVSKLLFDIPILGSTVLLFIVTFPFILANLLVGIMFSTFADTQLQASQMSTLFFLPSMLLSGFIFPFYGMPVWAQYIGSCLPLTHYIRITRGIFLKGNGWVEIWPDMWPIFLFIFFVVLIGVSRFRQTLD